jgi:menaquinone-dependent protoporphyrinogen oxidase
MCEVPVFYATTEGQTRRIAERVAEQIRKHGLNSRAVAIISQEASHVDWDKVRGVAVGASLHIQKHQSEAVAFVRVHRAALSARPSLFFSVSLSAASQHQHEVAAAARIAESFAAKTGWTPTSIVSLAGRLAYTQYNWLVRRLMRRIARKEGASTDITRDHEYTDWLQVERMADELAYAVRRGEFFPGDVKSFLRAAS